MPRPTAAEDVFRAVADPTRRATLELLSRHPELPVTELAEQLSVGMPMLSRHLGVLRDAGLVRQRQSGRQRLYRIDPEPLRELYDWAALFSDFWQERVTNLRACLDRQETGESDRAT
jgi:DNA-binding transcriptional ArsR family regulator